MRLSPIRIAALCAIATLTCTPGASARGEQSTASPRIAGALIQLVTTPLQRGTSAQISARAIGVTECSLSFMGPSGLRSGPYGVALLHVQEIEWTWVVPQDARGGRWIATVACLGAKDVRATLRLASTSPPGDAAIVQLYSLRAAPSAEGVSAYDGGKGGGLDCAPGVLDPKSGYCTGYCTEFVWSQRPDLAKLGNASSWWRSTTSPKGHRAVVGAVAWWGARSPQRPYGHVALVVGVGAGTVTVKEMNHGPGHWNVEDTRTIGLRTEEVPDGYIYAGSLPRRPADLFTAAGGVTDFNPYLAAGPSGAATYRYASFSAAPGPPIPPGHKVDVECADAPTGGWYRIQSAPWSGRYVARSSAFLGQAPGYAACPPPPPPKPKPVALEAGPFGSPTYRHYTKATGPGRTVAPFGLVQVICRVFWFSGRTSLIAQHGFWYRIQDPRWHGTYYAPADAFLNGDPAGGPYRIHVKDDVRTCSGRPDDPRPG